MNLDSIKTITDFNVEKRRVFLRLDLNVPLKDGVITDTTRLDAATPTIQYLLDQKAKLVIASHLGRPKGKEDKYSLEPVALWLQQKFNVEVHFIDEVSSEAPKAILPNLKPKQIVLLENLRFDEGETNNSKSLSCLLYTSPSPRDATLSRMPSSA